MLDWRAKYNMKTYAVYVSGKATRIRKAILKYKELANAIKCVISDEAFDIELQDFFSLYNIAYYAFDYNGKEKNTDRNLLLSDFILHVFNEEQIDYGFSFGGHILKGELLVQYQNHLINFHPGILPDVAGLNAIDKALQEKKKYIGNTVHFIDAGVDTGPIIMQNIMLAENFEIYGYDIFLDEQVDLMWKTYKLIESNRIQMIDGRVRIDDADYCTSNIYPKFRV